MGLSWTQMFRCRVVKDGVSLGARQQLAGRVQARESAVVEMGMAERVSWLYRELEADKKVWQEREKERAAQGLPEERWQPDKATALKMTYVKTGVRERGDNSHSC